MIRHSVVFKLKFPKGSSEETEFLKAAAKLSSIPGVHNFQSLRQVSKKNNYEYCLVMDFDSEKDYEAYNNHSDHSKFVQTYWIKFVDEFMELDYEPLK